MLPFFQNQTTDATSDSQVILQPGEYKFGISGTLDGAIITPYWSIDNVNFYNINDPSNTSQTWSFDSTGLSQGVSFPQNSYIRVILSGSGTSTDVTVTFGISGFGDSSSGGSSTDSIYLYTQGVITSEDQLPSTAEGRLNGQYYIGADFTDTLTGTALQSGHLYEWVDNENGGIMLDITGVSSGSIPTAATVDQINEGTGSGTYISPPNWVLSNDHLYINNVQQQKPSCLMTDNDITLVNYPNILNVIWNATDAGYAENQIVIQNASTADIAIQFVAASMIQYNESDGDFRLYTTNSAGFIITETSDYLYLGMGGGLDDNIQLAIQGAFIHLQISIESSSYVFYNIDLFIYCDGININVVGRMDARGAITSIPKIPFYSRDKKNYIPKKQSILRSFIGPYPMSTIGDITDNLTTESSVLSLSANQGYVLNQSINTLTDLVSPSATKTQIETGEGNQPIVPSILSTATIYLKSSSGTSQGIDAGGTNSITNGADAVDGTDYTILSQVESLILNGGFSYVYNENVDNSEDIVIATLGDISINYDSTNRQIYFLNSSSTNSYQFSYATKTQINQYNPSFYNAALDLAPGVSIYLSSEGQLDTTFNINQQGCYMIGEDITLSDSVNGIDYNFPIFKNSWSSTGNTLQVYINAFSLTLKKRIKIK